MLANGLRRGSNLLKRLRRRLRSPLAEYRFVISDWTELGDVKRSAAVLDTMRFSNKLTPQLRDGPDVQRVVVVAPHPDDEVIGPGGTVLKLCDAGCDVTVVYVTDGDPVATTPDRRQEAEAVARTLGFTPKFLGARAGAIPVDDRGVEALAEAIMEARPEAVLVPFVLDDNDDHRRVNQLLWRALRSNRLPPSIELWTYQVYSSLPGNVVVDITDYAERKAQAIRLYASQVAKRDWAHFALGLNAFNLRFLRGTNEPRYAEMFFVVPGAQYAELCDAYFLPDPSACYYWPGYRADAS